MPKVNCKDEGCKLTISYPDVTTGLFGVTIQVLTEEITSDNTKPTRILTLECSEGHRHNYIATLNEIKI